MASKALCSPMVATNGKLIFGREAFLIALTLPAASSTTSGKLSSIFTTLLMVNHALPFRRSIVSSGSL